MRVQWYSDVIVETVDKEGRGLALRGLLASGCSKTIVLKKFTTNINDNSKAVKYQTYGGTMTSTATSNVDMKLIEFSSSKSITFPCQVDGKTQADEAYYDIVRFSFDCLFIFISFSFSPFHNCRHQLHYSSHPCMIDSSPSFY